jgi:hypothetical protein
MVGDHNEEETCLKGHPTIATVLGFGTNLLLAAMVVDRVVKRQPLKGYIGIMTSGRSMADQSHSQFSLLRTALSRYPLASDCMGDALNASSPLGTQLEPWTEALVMIQ